MKQTFAWKLALLAPVVFGAVVAVGGVPEVAATPNLFVASAGTTSVVEFDGTTGAFVSTFASGSGTSFPRGGLVFGPQAPSSVPEPSTFLLLGSGLAGLATLRLRSGQAWRA